MITTTMLTLAVTLTQAPAAKAAQVSVPAPVTTIDTGKLKGEPTQLAWSPDGTKLFLQTSERDAAGMTKNHRFFVMSAAYGQPSPVDAPPAWAAEYWAWKSGQFAPGSSTYGVDLKEEQRTSIATAAPMGGSLARGVPDGANSGTTADDVAMRAQQQQKQRVISLTVKGEIVGEFVGLQFLPGYTFSWSPASIAMIAYANASGRLVLMDREGQKQAVDGTRNVILPAWSPDGSQVAFLQKSGKNKYELFIAGVRP
jgi:hypothetical protein